MLTLTSPLLPTYDPTLNLFLLSIGFIALCIASITDLKTREVPDFLNYGLVITGVGVSIMLSFYFWDYTFFLRSIFGLLLCYGFGAFMFYLGQWGGGDSKMLMGIGALFGAPFAIQDSFLLGFILNIFLAGALYGIGWTAYLAFSQRKKYSKEFRAITSTTQHKILRAISMALLIAVIALIAIDFDGKRKITLLWILFFLPLLYYTWLLIKCVEKTSMLVLLPIAKLTEGDWIAKNVSIKGKYLCGPKDLGISKRQIRTLKLYESKGLIKKILVKQGIPFIPSFLLALFFTVIWGNPFMAALMLL